jgi:hypothetical protein
VGQPFELDPSPGDTWAWSNLQNVGSAPATPLALQIGWTGDAALADVVLEREGGERVSLHAGSGVSPSVVRLSPPQGRDSAALSPGETVRLGLRFESQSTGDSFALGPSVLFMDGGCRLALGTPRTRACSLRLSNVRPSGNDPRRVVLSVTNKSDQPLQLTAVDLLWPLEENGPLVALYLGGKLRHTFEGGLRHTPAALDLRRMLDDPVMLPPGKPVSIWLEFQRPAAPAPYVVSMAAADGCVSSTTTWLEPPECGVDASGFSTHGRRAQLLLRNVLPMVQEIDSIDLFWPAGTNGPLVSVLIDGKIAWRGRKESSPAAISLARGTMLRERSSGRLELLFDPQSASSTSPGTEGGGSAVASADYTLVAGLRSGCRIVFSTLDANAPVGCQLSAGELSARPDDAEIAVQITNTGEQATLRRLVASWPTRNGALTSVRLGSLTLFDGSQPPGPQPFNLELQATDGAVLERNATLTLVLRFAERASANGYALSLSFDDASGQPCSDLLITPPDDNVECALSVTDLEAEGERNIQVWVRNEGADEVELQYLNVVWPFGDGLNQLVSVYMVDGDDEFLLWSGNMRQSPAMVPLTGQRAAIIDPGDTIRLQMHFIQLIGVSDPKRELKLTVGTAEGCLAFYPSNERSARPETESFSGVIVDLPDTLWGEWVIQLGASDGREQRRVLVDEKTKLEPPTVAPKRGDSVRIEAIPFEDSETTRWRALRVTFRSFEQYVHHVGRIVDLDRSSPANTRPAWIRIDGYAGLIRIVPATRVVGELLLGVRVEIEGSLGPNGSITASTVTVIEAPDDQLVTVRGIVQQSRRADEIAAGMQLWFVSKYRVEVDTNRVDSSLVPANRLPRPGERVEVHGRLSGNRIAATHVATVRGPTTARFSGVLSALPASGVLGEWTVRTDGGEIETFVVESASIVDMRSAPAAVGNFVYAVVQEVEGGRRVALGVRLDWPD